MRTLPDAFSLAGRVALVTGAGAPDGIGYATARLLGQLGASVAVAATTERVHERAAELLEAGVRAVDFAPDGVTVNAVAPGWIATGSQTVDEVRHGGLTPVGRSAWPDEVAAATAFLCTPGSFYVTGQCLVIDGGNSVAEERA